MTTPHNELLNLTDLNQSELLQRASEIHDMQMKEHKQQIDDARSSNLDFEARRTSSHLNSGEYNIKTNRRSVIEQPERTTTRNTGINPSQKTPVEINNLIGEGSLTFEEAHHLQKGLDSHIRQRAFES